MCENEGRFWPTEKDMQPLPPNIFVVARKDDEGRYLGTVDITISEDKEAVERRLCDQFRLYRAAQAAKRAIVGWAEGFTV